jgi:hypothetical protein
MLVLHNKIIALLYHSARKIAAFQTYSEAIIFCVAFTALIPMAVAFMTIVLQLLNYKITAIHPRYGCSSSI